MTGRGLQRILITGGMGFVGTAIAKRFAKRYIVTVADRLDFGPSQEILPLVDEGRVELVVTDLADISALHDRIAAGEFDAIVHLASLTHIPLCERYPEFAYRSNVVSALGILSRLPQGCRLVNFSTSSTYSEETRPHREDDSQRAPIDLYGLSKKHVEDLAEYYAQKRGLSILHVRLANAAGYGETNPKLLGAILQQVHTGADSVELGNLTPRRDFIHIDDIAWVIERLLQTWPVEAGSIQVFNVGTGHEPISVRELFDRIVAVAGRAIALRSVAERQRGRDRELLAVNCDKLRNLFPEYRPKRVDDWLPAVVREPGLRIDDTLEARLVERYALR